MKIFGYRRGEARIFDLKDGQRLPDGWTDRPPKGDHPHDVELGIKPDERPKLELKGSR